MSDKTRSTICKALVVGAALYTAYEITQFSMSQAALEYEYWDAKECLLNATDTLTISLDHILAEQLA